MPSKPSSVIYVATSEKIGGGNHVLMSLIEGLDENRFKPILVVPRAGPLTQWADERSLPWHALPVNLHDAGRLGLLRSTAFLAKLMTTHRTRIIHAIAPTCYRAAGLAGRLTGVRRVCHVEFPPTAGELDWNLRFGVDAIVTCYEQMQHELTGKVMTRRNFRLAAIPNSVDVVRFTPNGHPGKVSAPQSGKDHVVVIVGHLSEVKGYPTFLEAAARIKMKLPRTRFLAVGGETITTGYKEKLRAFADQLHLGESVEFLGWCTNVPAVLRSADVMVLPSLQEGLPLAVLEAMACGLPVVASNVNGTPEAVVDGETGLLVEPNDAAGLARKVLTLLEDSSMRHRMGLAGRQRVESCFTQTEFVRRMQSLYTDLIAA